jgi:hypothetical protein
MAGPENVAFAELCRNANHRLIEALDYMRATPHPDLPGPTAEQEQALYMAKILLSDARKALERCYR